MELQVLRHPPLRSHPNIIDLLAVIYHDAGDAEEPKILPALVLEYAELGSLKTFQEQGYGHSFQDKITIALDSARGIEALHQCGIIHGDVKSSNMLVCKHPTRKFIVKISDFGFSLTVNDKHLVGRTELLCAPEAYDQALDPRYLKQMDMYGYGLLLHAVLKNGTPSYLVALEHGGPDDQKKIKVTGLLASVSVMNVLLTGPGREPHPLLLLCKIIFYCLQRLPQNRFHNMSRIVLYLEILEAVIRDEEDPAGNHVAGVLQRLSAGVAKASEANTQGAELHIGVLLTMAAELRVLTGLESNSSAACNPEQAQGLQTQLSATVEMVLQAYVSKLSTLNVPMFEVVSANLRSRMQTQLAQVSTDTTDGRSGLTNANFLPMRGCHLLLDCIGLVAEQDALIDEAIVLVNSYETPKKQMMLMLRWS